MNKKTALVLCLLLINLAIRAEVALKKAIDIRHSVEVKKGICALNAFDSLGDAVSLSKTRTSQLILTTRF